MKKILVGILALGSWSAFSMVLEVSKISNITLHYDVPCETKLINQHTMEADYRPMFKVHLSDGSTIPLRLSPQRVGGIPGEERLCNRAKEWAMGFFHTFEKEIVSLEKLKGKVLYSDDTASCFQIKYLEVVEFKYGNLTPEYLKKDALKIVRSPMECTNKAIFDKDLESFLVFKPLKTENMQLIYKY
jgi:hypothetical protein